MKNLIKLNIQVQGIVPGFNSISHEGEFMIIFRNIVVALSIRYYPVETPRFLEILTTLLRHFLICSIINLKSHARAISAS